AGRSSAARGYWPTEAPSATCPSAATNGSRARCSRSAARPSCWSLTSGGIRSPLAPKLSRRSSASSACASVRNPLLRDEAHGAVALEDPPLHVLDGRDLIRAHLLRHVSLGQALALHVALDQPPVLDDDDRLAFENAPRAQ